MKLQEINESVAPETEAIHAFFRPAKGPNDIPGVELLYLQSKHTVNHAHADQADKEAEEHESAGRDPQGRRERSRADYLRGRDHEGFYSQMIDWWASEKDFTNGKEGFSNHTKEKVEKKYPKLHIHKNYNEAVLHMEQEGR